MYHYKVVTPGQGTLVTAFTDAHNLSNVEAVIRAKRHLQALGYFGGAFEVHAFTHVSDEWPTDTVTFSLNDNERVAKYLHDPVDQAFSTVFKTLDSLLTLQR